jgi:hypothetical protein
MFPENSISPKAIKKLQLYTGAVFLFNQGKSHPQIVRHLNEFETDLEFLTEIVDKAMREDWDKLYLEARKLYAEGLNYEEVLDNIRSKESDLEIAKWVCGEWYKWKSVYADCLIEGSTNRAQGVQWIAISAIGITMVFVLVASWVSKGIWILAFIGSIVQWLVGIQQRNLSRKIQNLFALELDPTIENEN